MDRQLPSVRPRVRRRAPLAVLALALAVSGPGRGVAATAPALVVTPATLQLAPGVKLRLAALYDPDGAGPLGAVPVEREADWSTTNPDVADVDSRGEVEGRAPGQATITAEYLGLRAAVPVTVASDGAGAPGPTPTPAPPPGADPVGPEGFGATTPGGAGQPVYRVTSLADSGPGTLRDAIARGGRYVVFDVGGVIRAESPLEVQGAFITIDGTTAPPPGITITHRGLRLRGTGVHDVVVRNLRIRDAAASSSTDCLQVSHGAWNVLIEHVSTSGCADGALDITGDPARPGPPETRDVTVAWSIFGPPVTGKKAMLVKYGTTRLSVHHNLFVDVASRNPEVTREGLAPDADTTIDFRNNVVWHWDGGTGTRVHSGARANVVGNLYGNPGGGYREALIVGTSGAAWAAVYAAGNLALDGTDLDRRGTVGAPLPAAPVTTTDACTAALEVLARAGAWPRDATDATLTAITLDACGAPPPTPGPPAPGPAPPPGDTTPSLALTPATVDLRRGEKLLFLAVYDPDGVGPAPAVTVNTQASWSTTDPDVVDVNQRGEAEGRLPGQVTIRAEYQGLAAEALARVP